MQTLTLMIIVVLAAIAVAGWLRAWGLGRGGPAKSGPAHAERADLSVAQRDASTAITGSIQKASELFQKNLTVQALKINDELEGLAGSRLRKQVEDFAKVLDGLTATATASVGQLETLIDQRRQALEAGLSTEVQDEKNRTLERFYSRLDDIVASYVIQSLGNELDLSGQLPFVIKVLNDNKAAIKQDLTSDY